MYAYYTAEGIWSTGTTPEDAIGGFLLDNQQDREQYGEMLTAPMTDRLAERVERHGFDCHHDSFTILSGGTLDIA